MEKTIKLLHNRKAKMLLIFIIVASIFVVGMVVAKPSYAVKVDGETICVVEDKKIVEQIVQDIKEEKESTLQKEIFISQEISIEKAVKEEVEETHNLEEMKEKIEDSIEVSIQAYALVIDEVEIAAFNTEEEINEILEVLKEEYSRNDDEKEYKEVGFVEEVNRLEKTLPLDQVKEKEEVLEYIKQGKEEAQTYTLQEGDAVWNIMRDKGLTLAEMEEVNPGVDLEKVKIGQEITIIAPVPYINIQSIEAITYEEEIPFDVQYEGSNSMYEGETKEKNKGVEGKKKVFAEIERINGIQQDKKVVKEEILKKPEMRVVVRGTKERPKTMATGKLQTPARGRQSSSFGARWGSQHNGIDLAMPTGTPVKAADGGKVTFSGSQGTYGKLIIINHENGLETRYAHNSNLLVKAGDRVYKGQIIAKSGNTGRSTGPHLHFEVRKNGTPVNPRNYI